MLSESLSFRRNSFLLRGVTSGQERSGLSIGPKRLYGWESSTVSSEGRWSVSVKPNLIPEKPVVDHYGISYVCLFRANVVDYILYFYICSSRLVV